jgi:hypothetical protein
MSQTQVLTLKEVIPPIGRNEKLVLGNIFSLVDVNGAKVLWKKGVSDSP